MVSRELAVLNPPGFLGAHVLQLFSFPSGDPSEFERFGPKEYAALEFLGWFQSVGGYNQMNGTRPQTIAAALSDSPVGQLAYNELFENFGNGTSLVTVDQVLTQVSLYWLTNTSATAVRYHYSEGHSGAKPAVSQGRIGVAVFADDFQTIRPLAERDNANIVHWSEFDTGGHYAAAPRRIPRSRYQILMEFHPHRVAGVHSWAGNPGELAPFDSSEGGREAVVVPLEPY